MSRYKIYEQHGLNYLTITTVGWIDVFSRQRYRDIVIESLKYCQTHKGLHVYGYVIMSNHIHIIVHAEGFELSDVLRDFKKFTASRILKSIQTDPESRREWLMYLFKFYAQSDTNRDHQFWQTDNHPIALWSQDVIWQKLDYIHLNPVRAGIVANPARQGSSECQKRRRSRASVMRCVLFIASHDARQLHFKVCPCL